MIIDPQFAQIVFLKCLVNKPSVSRLWAGAAVEGRFVPCLVSDVAESGPFSAKREESRWRKGGRWILGKRAVRLTSFPLLQLCTPAVVLRVTLPAVQGACPTYTL